MSSTCPQVVYESRGRNFMVRLNLRRTACVIAFLLSTMGELLAAEAAGPQPPAAAGAGEKDAAIRGAIKAVFRTQVDAWNRGDVDAFMEHYWKSDDLTFSSGGKTTRGWRATLDHYRERYPTREKMG